MPKVLLVCPTFNQAHLIEETLESLMKQTYKDWHLTIVDDGSEDNTKELITDYIYKNAGLAPGQRRSIAFYSIPHRNASSALNHGFAYSEFAGARYETWISSDNIYYPDFLRVLVKELNRHPMIKFVYSDFDVIRPDGRVLRKTYGRPYSKQRLESVYEQGMCFMWRKELREKAGYWFDERLQCEDYNMALRMSDFGKFKHIPRVLGAYRVHPAQRGTDGIEEHSLEAKKFYFLWKQGDPEGIPQTHLVDESKGE